jgi:hypothetical protein
MAADAWINGQQRVYRGTVTESGTVAGGNRRSCDLASCRSQSLSVSGTAEILGQVRLSASVAAITTWSTSPEMPGPGSLSSAPVAVPVPLSRLRRGSRRPPRCRMVGHPLFAQLSARVARAQAAARPPWPEKNRPVSEPASFLQSYDQSWRTRWVLCASDYAAGLRLPFFVLIGPFPERFENL